MVNFRLTVNHSEPYWLLYYTFPHQKPFFSSLQTNSADGACEELAVFEHWSDRTALDSHRSSAHVKEFGEKSAELMAAAGAKFDVQEYRSCGIWLPAKENVKKQAMSSKIEIRQPLPLHRMYHTISPALKHSTNVTNCLTEIKKQSKILLHHAHDL